MNYAFNPILDFLLEGNDTIPKNEEVSSPRSNRNLGSFRQSGGSSYRNSGSFRPPPPAHILQHYGYLEWHVMTQSVPPNLSPAQAAPVACTHLSFHTDVLKQMRTHAHVHMMVSQYTPLKKDCANMGNLYRALLFLHFYGRIWQGLPSGYLQVLDTSDVTGTESDNLPYYHLKFDMDGVGLHGEGLALTPASPSQLHSFPFNRLLILFGMLQSESVEFVEDYPENSCDEYLNNEGSTLNPPFHCRPIALKQYGSSINRMVGGGGCSSCVFLGIPCSWQQGRVGIGHGGVSPVGRQYVEEVADIILNGS